MMPIRVAHLVSHPIHYFAPLYRELAQRDDIDLTVYFYSKGPAGEFEDAEFGRSIAWDTPLLEGYASQFCHSAAKTAAGPVSLRPRGDVATTVAAGDYDVVWAHGYAHATTWLSLARAKAGGARLLIRDEQTLLHPRAKIRSFTKAIALRGLFARASGLYIGEENKRFFQHYGMPDARLYPARYCVDNAFFRAQAATLAPQRAAIRAAFGIDDDAPVVLFAGKLVDKKQPLKVIEAFAHTRAIAIARGEAPPWLLMAGDGPLRSQCEAFAARLGITDRVRITGFLNQSEIPRAYTAADIFVLASKLHETWGLVVNEAMNFRLPVVVSDRVGCGADLVLPGENGRIVPHDDTAKLADAILRLALNADMRRTFGERSAEIVRDYSIESAADGIVAACTASEARRGAWKRGRAAA